MWVKSTSTEVRFCYELQLIQDFIWDKDDKAEKNLSEWKMHSYVYQL